MRHLTAGHRRTRAIGLTLIEIMVALAIGALLLTFAAPLLSDHFSNTRMREGLHTVMAQALFAQSEALKRNTTVRLTVTATDATVSVLSTGLVLREQPLTDGLEATPGILDFGANGLPTPLGTGLQVTVSQPGMNCAADHVRCPRIKVDGGGGIRVCSNHLTCS